MKAIKEAFIPNSIREYLMDGIKIGHWSQGASSVLGINARKRLTYTMALTLGPIFFVLAYVHFQNQHLVLSLLNAICGGLFVLNAIWVHRHYRLFVHYSISVIFVLVCFLLAVYRIGSVGAFWAFPLLVGVIFALDSIPSKIFSIVLVLSTSAIILQLEGTGTAARFFGSLCATWLITTAMLRHLKETHNELVGIAAKDPLTGAYNRRILREITAEQKQDNQPPIAVIMFDIDYFKKINDKFGHNIGDEVLRKIVAHIKQVLCKEHSVIRLGGDEFLILLENESSETALTIANNLRQQIGSAEIIKDHPVRLSMGVSAMTEKATLKQLLKYADIALYEAKSTGRDRAIAYAELSEPTLAG